MLVEYDEVIDEVIVVIESSHETYMSLREWRYLTDLKSKSKHLFQVGQLQTLL